MQVAEHFHQTDNKVFVLFVVVFLKIFGLYLLDKEQKHKPAKSPKNLF